MDDWKKVRKRYFGRDVVVRRGSGWVDFSPDGMDRIRNGAFRSYKEYLEVQKKSCESCRVYFAMCSMAGSITDSFIGRLDRFDPMKEHVLFRRIMVNGMFSDGIGFFGKEDHVWMDAEPFSEYQPGDCLSFRAEIFRYMRQNPEKRIDYGLECPTEIRKVESYHVPTDEELVNQQIEQLVCETCRYEKHCYFRECLMNEAVRTERIALLKSLEPGRFTPLTVLLAYELEYRFLMQTGGLRTEQVKNPEVSERFVAICESQPVYYVGDPQEAIVRMLYPEKPRLYIE